jgi:hypothetical protein
MAQNHWNSELSRLYFDVAALCFDRAAGEEDANGAEVFRRMGRRYMAEAEFYDAALQCTPARRLPWPWSS